MKMRKVPKRFLAFGMLICMIVSLFPATALAGTSTRAGGAEYQLTDEWENRSPVENAIEFEGTDKVTFHALPGELGMYTNAQNVLLYDAPAGDFTAAVKVTNTGKRDGDEVVQLYVSHSKQGTTERMPLCALKGFKRISLKKGESKIVSFVLSPEDLALVASSGILREKAGKADIYIGGGQPQQSQGVFYPLCIKGDVFQIN